MLKAIVFLLTAFISCELLAQARDEVEFGRKLSEWESWEIAKPEQLLQDAYFTESLLSPTKLREPLLACISSPHSSLSRRQICMLLLQKAPVSLFVEGYARLLEAWQGGNVKSADVVSVLNLPVVFHNRLALIYARPEVSSMLSVAILAAESRANDPDSGALASLLSSLYSGGKRTEALIALNRDDKLKRSPYAALPSEEDQVSVFRKGFEQFAIRPLTSIALFLVAGIVVPII